MDRSDSGISAYKGDPPNPGREFGEYAECELCGNQHHCTDRYGLLTCQDCQHALLP